MARLSSIFTHPIKSLDPAARDAVEVTEYGGLSGDRAFAIVDRDGEYVNGKRTPKVHRLRTDVDRDAGVLSMRLDGEDEVHRFALDDDRDREALDDWLTDYFGVPVSLVPADGPAMTDSSDPGPTLISRATLREVASWFPGIEPDGMRRRLRPNLVIEGVPAFWEDRLIGGGGRRLHVGDVTLEGTAPVPRCAVPARDPLTGEEYEGFRETFVRQREKTFPDWADEEAFDHFFAVMVATHVPEEERGQVLRVGDGVRLPDGRTGEPDRVEPAERPSS